MFHNNLLFSNEIDLFQMVMLYVYVGLQLVLLILGIKVFQINFWLRHIQPEALYIWWGASDGIIEKYDTEMRLFYDRVCWQPLVKKLILEFYGKDIGDIIMDYYASIDLENEKDP